MCENRRLTALKAFQEFAGRTVNMACIIHDLDSTKQMHPGLIAKLLDAAKTENGRIIARICHLRSRQRFQKAPHFGSRMLPGITLSAKIIPKWIQEGKYRIQDVMPVAECQATLTTTPALSITEGNDQTIINDRRLSSIKHDCACIRHQDPPPTISI